MAAPLQPQNNNALSGQQQGPTTMGGGSSFLAKKGLLARGGAASIVSPTDNVLSPCSAKLSGAKQRHFQKGKPMGLASQLSQLAASGSSGSVAASTAEKPKPDF